MDINSTIEMQNGIIKMLLDKIENLEAEITKLRNLADNTANEDDRQLRDEAAKIKIRQQTSLKRCLFCALGMYNNLEMKVLYMGRC